MHESVEFSEYPLGWFIIFYITLKYRWTGVAPFGSRSQVLMVINVIHLMILILDYDYKWYCNRMRRLYSRFCHIESLWSIYFQALNHSHSDPWFYVYMQYKLLLTGLPHFELLITFYRPILHDLARGRSSADAKVTPMKPNHKMIISMKLRSKLEQREIN